MKLTNILFRQHIRRHFVKNWQIQGKRKLVDKGVVKSLSERGISLYKPEDILNENQTTFPVAEEIQDYIPKPVVYDSTHSDWHTRVCYTYKDNNLLLEGLDQAKVITKTIAIQGLPEKYHLDNLPSGIDKQTKRIILNAHVFDAEQQKLPIVKDPLRPAWNFPRSYGITDDRVNKIIFSKLLQMIELTMDINIVAERNLLHDLHFSYPFEKAGDLIQLQLRSDMLLTSINSLSRASDIDTFVMELPNLFPVACTNSLNKDHIYKIRNVYPIKMSIAKSHPHTLFVHYNGTEVKNIYEEGVTEPQVLGRSLMKTFCVAASYAKQRFGDDLGILPAPITVQCVQSDGRLFDFGILQLNTLDLNESSGIKNVWYYTPRIPLFTTCCYKLGKPILEGYNDGVIKHLFALYKSI